MDSREASPLPPPAAAAVRWWLYGVAALVFVMVLVGGATRLTESGLSIVEWQPVTGALPPLSEAQWLAEFEKYKAIPQYRELNRGMSLAEFKTIYWWEWAHRLLGRVIGIAFLVPLLAFAARGWIGSALRWRLIGIFALGAVQGAVGWWMVASGLTERTSVAPYRLAFHLTLAALILAAIVWTARRLSATARDTLSIPARARLGAIVVLVLVVAQIFLGALVAGLDAGLIYNTWPLIDGALVPKTADLFFETPWWRNLFENTLMVQFVHRMAAYLLWVVAIWHAADVARTMRGGAALNWALALAAAVTLQAAVGILALLHQMPFALAIAHQALAMVVLIIAVVHAEGSSEARATAPQGMVPAARQH